MPNVVSTVARAMAIFEAFAQSKREMSNSELAKQLALADSSCLDLMHTLHQLGYLNRSERTRRYYPTGRLMALAEQIDAEDPIVYETQEALDFLAEETGESAYVGRIDGNAVKVVALKDGRYKLRHVLTLGQRVALHVSALGKAVLGTLAPGEASKLLATVPMRKLTPATLTDREEVLREVELGRQRGWYETRSEGEIGADALAVSGMLGATPVAISISGPTERFEQNEERYVEALTKVARQVFQAKDTRRKR